MKTTIFFLILLLFCASVSADVGSSVSITIHATLDGNVTYVPTATPSPTLTTYHSSGGGGAGGGSSTFTPKPIPTTVKPTPVQTVYQAQSATPVPTTIPPTTTPTTLVPSVIITGDESGFMWIVIIAAVAGVSILLYLWFKRRDEDR